MSRALDVVARVRKAREQDSLIGLAQATAAWQQRVEDTRTALSAYDNLDQVIDADAHTFLAHRALLTVRAAGLDRLAEAEHDSEVTADLARQHWVADRTERRAIELLQDRHAAREAEARVRRDQRELDAIAEQRHQRLQQEQNEQEGIR
jgi:flagellar biosynthesis chaperone FliJ